MSKPLVLPAPRFEAFTHHSRILFHWRADEMRLTGLGGDEATFTRAGTATVVDSDGTSRTVGYHQSRWTSVDTNADSVRDAPALQLTRAAAETLSWPYLARPQVMTVYVRFVEDGTLGVANARVLHIGNAAGAGAYLRLLSTGSFYRAEHHNGSVAVNATLGAAPTSGQRVELRCVLNANGSVTIGQSINEGAETTASSGAPGSGPAIATAWSGLLLWLNGESTSVTGTGLYRTCKAAAGVRSLADCRGRLW